MLLGLIRLLHSFHHVPRNLMEDRGWSSFQAPSLSAKSRPAGTFLLRRLHSSMTVSNRTDLPSCVLAKTKS